jgi:hypothetical protein
VLGLAPLVFATGVASLTRRGVGTAVFAGMIAATAARLLIHGEFDDQNRILAGERDENDDAGLGRRDRC